MEIIKKHNVLKLWHGIVLLLSLVALIFAACNTKTLYDESLTIPNEGWPASLPAYFNVPIDDSLTSNAIFLKVSNTINYKYQNIYFFITLVFPDGRIVRDTVNFDLANNYGEWHGKGMGNIKTLQLPYRSNVFFPTIGNYTFYIEQAMRDDTLKNIKAIGLQIQKEE